MKNSIYHKILANYFKTKNLYFDVKNQKQPNARKCSELPWQQTKAKLWDDVTVTLSNIKFIEAKCRSNLVYNLISDYNLVLECLPENENQKLIQNTKKDEIINYAQNLIQHSDDTGKKLSVIDSIISKSKVKTSTGKNNELHSDRYNILAVISQFILTELYYLKTFCFIDRFIEQHTFNTIKKIELFKSPSNSLILNRVSHINSKNSDIKLKVIQSSRSINKMTKPLFDDTILALNHNLISFYNLDSLKQVFEIKDKIKHDPNRLTKGWFSFAISGDGNILAAGRGKLKIFSREFVMKDEEENLQDYSVDIWKIKENRFLGSLTGHTGNVNCISISPNGRYAVTGSKDSTVRHWDLDKMKCLDTYSGHQKTVRSIQISPDGMSAISGGLDSQIIYWNFKLKNRNILTGHTGHIESVKITPDKKYAISCEKDTDGILKDIKRFSSGENKNIFIWDLSNMSILLKLSGDKYWVNAIDITPDGSLAVSVGYEGIIKLWNLTNGKCIFKHNTGNSNIHSITLEPDGSKLYTASGKEYGVPSDVNLYQEINEIAVWDIEKALSIPQLENSEKQSEEYDIESKNKEFVLINNSIHQIDLTNGEYFKLTCFPENVSFQKSIDKEHIIYYRNGLIGVWNLKENRLHKEFQSAKSLENLTILPNNDILFSERGNTDNHLLSYNIDLVKKLDITTGVISPLIPGYRNNEIVFRYIQGGKRIIFCHSNFSESTYNCNNSISIFDQHLKKTVELSTTDINKHNNNITDIAISPCEKFAATCASRSGIDDKGDDFILIWDLTTYKCISKLEIHKAPVNQINFSPNSGYLVSCSDDNSIVLCDIKNWGASIQLSEHSKSVKQFIITSDCLHLISVGADNTIRIWDLEKKECIALHPLKTMLSSIDYIDDKDSLIVKEQNETYLLKIANIKKGVKHIQVYPNWALTQKDDPFYNKLIYRCPYCSYLIEKDCDNIDIFNCPKCEQKSIVTYPWFCGRDIKKLEENITKDNTNFISCFESQESKLNDPQSLLETANHYYLNQNWPKAISFYEKLLFALGRNIVDKFPILNADYKIDNKKLHSYNCKTDVATIEYNIASSYVNSRRGCYGGFGVTVNNIKIRLQKNNELEKINNLDELILSFQNQKRTEPTPSYDKTNYEYTKRNVYKKEESRADSLLKTNTKAPKNKTQHTVKCNYCKKKSHLNADKIKVIKKNYFKAVLCLLLIIPFVFLVIKKRWWLILSLPINIMLFFGVAFFINTWQSFICPYCKKLNYIFNRKNANT